MLYLQAAGVLNEMRDLNLAVVSRRKKSHFKHTNLSLFCHLRHEMDSTCPVKAIRQLLIFPPQRNSENGAIHHTSCLTGIFNVQHCLYSLYLPYICNSRYSTLCASQIQQNKKIEWMLFVFLPFLFLFVWIWIVLFLFKSILVRIQMEANAFFLILFQLLVSIKNFVFWFIFQCLQNSKI